MSRTARLAMLFLVPLLAHPAVAQQGLPSELPDDVQVMRSVWCDTPDQLETVLRAHYNQKVPLSSAMEEINRFSPEACIPARAIVSMGKEVRRFTAGDAVLAVREARVHGVMRGSYALMMRPQTWYSAKVVAELTPL